MSASEKERRVYYQDIVYEVCNALEAAGADKPIVAGTIEHSTDQVVDALDLMLAELDILRRRDESNRRIFRSIVHHASTLGYVEWCL